MNDNSKPVSVTDACIGCGICATIAPNIFEMNSETNLSQVKSDADLGNLEKTKEAAAACPVAAIEVEE
ncbi:ferredoxin [Candidatus Gracilibacteria bacterium]|nr:ferredoxin [Candidatus Gracilibacteria bacterium]MCF7856149.1 ferredoxin [Candidatus Gracilibacteria bacterium]MCF7896615.1 ferredoxin [Candidatus Gracilibacteria bacterium]